MQSRPGAARRTRRRSGLLLVTGGLSYQVTDVWAALQVLVLSNQSFLISAKTGHNQPSRSPAFGSF